MGVATIRGRTFLSRHKAPDAHDSQKRLAAGSWARTESTLINPLHGYRCEI